MTLPTHLTFIRHGESEGNVVQRNEKLQKDYIAPEGHYDLHDWHYRLSPKGRKQAQRAAEHFDGGLKAHFDTGFVSPFIRTRETASLVGEPDFGWLIDDRLKERDWGIYGAVPASDRPSQFAITERLRNQSAWYTQLDGGESLASGVLIRVRDFLGTLHREHSRNRVVVVTHGEFMWTARYVLERMLPEEWELLDADRAQKIRNCTIVEYTREDPETGELHDRLGWRRITYTDIPEESPFDGNWQPLAARRRFSGAELADAVVKFGETKRRAVS